MTVNLEKSDLINLMKGIKPHYDIFDHPLIKGNGCYIGGFFDNWIWNSNLEYLSEEEIWQIYQLCISSWK